jgi:hypothetical protein
MSAMTNKAKREAGLSAPPAIPVAPATSPMLAEEFGVSRECVRQIEERAFEKVQKPSSSLVTSHCVRRL